MPRQEPPEPTRSELEEELTDKRHLAEDALEAAISAICEMDELIADLDGVDDSQRREQTHATMDLVNLARSNLRLWPR